MHIGLRKERRGREENNLYFDTSCIEIINRNSFIIIRGHHVQESSWVLAGGYRFLLFLLAGLCSFVRGLGASSAPFGFVLFTLLSRAASALFHSGGFGVCAQMQTFFVFLIHTFLKRFVSIR